MSARFWQILAVTPALASAAWAQDQSTVTVQVHVVSASGRDVYLDQGRDAGLAPGQLVRLFPPGSGELQATIRNVSATSARAELAPGFDAPPMGTAGEVETPKPAPAAAKQAQRPAASKPTPAHPPWQATIDPRSADQPLLVPTFGQKPDERPATYDGRFFLNSQWSRDDGGARSNDYWLTRVGVAGEANNALGFGERTRFATEFDQRVSNAPGDASDDDAQLRIDQFGVAFGGERWAPRGIEIGRFLSQHLPEIGLVDGVEAVQRYENGIRIGGGVGSYPLPFPSRDSGDDLGLHMFADYASDERRSFAATAGYQKTWHRGAPDRDLFLLRAEGRPWDGVSIYGAAKVDFYTSGDDRKGSGLDVTEFYGQARWDGAKLGVGAGVSHFSWPDLLRQEYQNLPDELVRDGKVDRLSLNSWARVHDDVRVTLRTDLWQDQTSDGTSFEAGVDWNNAFDSGAWLSVQVFRTDGSAQSGPGLRFMARRQCGSFWLNGAYRWYGYDVEGLLAGPESYTRQSLQLGAAWSVGMWDFDLMAEHWFGDQEDAYSIALYAQWRF